ncbi:OLC1v1018987C1 [Oldenlandia corymbosa var. corymbosa]|uniref:OLC1v1018987C1 n=1 Tax=Oldenlandia corymbosa var. corymbosa TaxID=529605 RepID=A0AAV1ECX5_OLDCO|nr:OLC1v1018987C1 [Oldenlandia corymbosa var. corymbosa]
MCCSHSYGFLTSKTEPLAALFTTVPALSSQNRPDPVAKVSFPVNPTPPQGLKTRVGYRVGSGNGSVFTRAAVQDVVSVAEESCFYDLLGIPKTGTQLEIKQAYKQLARKYHPDVSPPDRVEEYTQRFLRVQEAYEILSDPNRRALYDRDMAKGLHFARRRYQNYDEDMEDKSQWKSRWQNQVSELKRRSNYKDSGNMSWGARMRRQQNESSS